MGSECVSSASRFVDSARPSVYASFTKTLLRDEWSIPGIEFAMIQRTVSTILCALNPLTNMPLKIACMTKANRRLTKIAPTQYTFRKYHSFLTEYAILTLKKEFELQILLLKVKINFYNFFIGQIYIDFRKA